MVDIKILEIINKGTLTYVIATDVNGKNRVHINFNTRSFMSMTEREVEMVLEDAVGAEMEAHALQLAEISPIEAKINILKERNRARLKELHLDNEESDKTS